jgi:hypothetical protein
MRSKIAVVIVVLSFAAAAPSFAATRDDKPSNRESRATKIVRTIANWFGVARPNDILIPPRP